ncbi:GNAT family N-acetyltransferase [Fulvivirgaceae bacterium BMA10]|uniref:GNAT family N-acetyltransferase n=1 Tax=Splendidivirga corallicola TaxID=3051826 RepID=A0ABT8L0H8_9BACT|nr:GNAT family N-acetyltransferase [Fulvivirgaceae bacterium BMA10]
MKIRVYKTELKEILPFRTLFLQENNFQIRYNACHERNWSDSYLITFDDREIGYGSVKGIEELKDRNAIFEFYIIPPFRNISSLIFLKLIKVSGVDFIESQSNDLLLSSMLYEFSKNISSDTTLFADHAVTQYVIPGITFRLREKDDNVFGKKGDEAGDYVLEQNGEIVATGGFLLHYNIPFADLYMEVKKECRKNGLGTYILQELKKECYLAGRVPAARCSTKNTASRATLIKAGLKIAGAMLAGKIKSDLQ